MIKLDPTFTPCLAEEGDEIFANGVIRWNITKMQEYIDTHPSKVEYKQMELKLLTSDIRNINSLFSPRSNSILRFRLSTLPNAALMASFSSSLKLV
ncbi:hypothetical protein ACFVAD_01585 [Sutcliffiella sp. NPDC057660]|uniref:hypothetical protein n=1 Tax=Sutcliffiella sp. NPDC057660 TaxID=3346199 RepID=UPI003680B05C